MLTPVSTPLPVGVSVWYGPVYKTALEPHLDGEVNGPVAEFAFEFEDVEADAIGLIVIIAKTPTHTPTTERPPLGLTFPLLLTS